MRELVVRGGDLRLGDHIISHRVPADGIVEWRQWGRGILVLQTRDGKLGQTHQPNGDGRLMNPRYQFTVRRPDPKVNEWGEEAP